MSLFDVLIWKASPSSHVFVVPADTWGPTLTRTTREVLPLAHHDICLLVAWQRASARVLAEYIHLWAKVLGQ